MSATRLVGVCRLVSACQVCHLHVVCKSCVSMNLSVFAAALKMKAGPSNGKLYTEEDWNTDSGPDKEGGYMYSKVQSQTC